MKCSVEVWSRVTGFFRTISDFNKGKVSEYADRKSYKLIEGENVKSKGGSSTRIPE